MDKSARYKADQKNLTPGLYISQVNGGITTYDMRFLKPNTPPFLSNPVIHTIEHLFKAYAGKSKLADNVIYFGPMANRTGFYLIVKDLTGQQAIDLIRETVGKSSSHMGEIPGISASECGNYKEHYLEGARIALKQYYNLLKVYKVNNLSYN